ncbi:hypothetical protein RHGRI_036048 [Rhododendron griersonianum]|uniref:Embryonic stem cell-specific 5-hydroxymethylcytosine-binding protein n=1 Tax=Rhododendron griersonianum TaxID=479676 RepID=A0AAV6HS76_9ERIC|nr:hypothetical protein RHGRI_036048 [Rhododendron griersonianum]
MCGRARCTLRADDIPRACRLNGRPLRSINTDRYRPSYNVSPGRDIPVVRREDGSDGDGVVLQCMKWGLIPSFTKKDEKPDHYKMFNARAESIREKASFRRLVPKNRCVVAVEGYYSCCNGNVMLFRFYEWKKDGSKKQPYYIHLKDGRPLVFAALYDTWKNTEGEIHYTFTILTTSSSSTLGWLHDRMPVILGDKESMDTWLFGSPSSKFETVLKPYEGPDLVWYPVTSAMGKPSFDGPECVMEIKLKTEETKPISQFFSKKGVDSEQGSKLGSMHGDLIKNNQPKSLKEEPQTQDSLDHPSVTDEGNDESKPNISTLTNEGAGNLPIKRNYEELSADAKPAGGKAEKPQTSPARKKKNVGPADDKQPTLLSFFGKR